MIESRTRLVDGIRSGDRRSLARAITLAESTRPDHQDEAAALLDELLPLTGSSVRVGISGAPGVGKSMFIEAFGGHLADTDHRVAVLAVDPSSTRSGGSILGDKTRMSELARHPRAFIRPSPSGGTLGGVARRTREAMLLCEAFGFDVVLVETVGVGQSEAAVGDMVDVFLLLVQPGAGDELQGMKRGIVELADIVVVTKADGELAGAAEQARADYGTALRFVRPRHEEWEPRAMTVSSVTGHGVADVWAAVSDYRARLSTSGALEVQRIDQAKAWFWSEVTQQLLAQIDDDAAQSNRARELERAVGRGEMSPMLAASTLLGARRGTTAAPRAVEAIESPPL
jgi:LAO/AO transport system kinase